MFHKGPESFEGATSAGEVDVAIDSDKERDIGRLALEDLERLLSEAEHAAGAANKEVPEAREKAADRSLLRRFGGLMKEVGKGFSGISAWQAWKDVLKTERTFNTHEEIVDTLLEKRRHVLDTLVEIESEQKAKGQPVAPKHRLRTAKDYQKAGLDIENPLHTATTESRREAFTLALEKLREANQGLQADAGDITEKDIQAQLRMATTEEGMTRTAAVLRAQKAKYATERAALAKVLRQNRLRRTELAEGIATSKKLITQERSTDAMQKTAVAGVMWGGMGLSAFAGVTAAGVSVLVKAFSDSEKRTNVVKQQHHREVAQQEAKEAGVRGINQQEVTEVNFKTIYIDGLNKWRKAAARGEASALMHPVAYLLGGGILADNVLNDSQMREGAAELAGDVLGFAWEKVSSAIASPAAAQEGGDTAGEIFADLTGEADPTSPVGDTAGGIFADLTDGADPELSGKGGETAAGIFADLQGDTPSSEAGVTSTSVQLESLSELKNPFALDDGGVVSHGESDDEDRPFSRSSNAEPFPMRLAETESTLAEDTQTTMEGITLATSRDIVTELMKEVDFEAMGEEEIRKKLTEAGFSQEIGIESLHTFLSIAELSAADRTLTKEMFSVEGNIDSLRLNNATNKYPGETEVYGSELRLSDSVIPPGAGDWSQHSIDIISFLPDGTVSFVLTSDDITLYAEGALTEAGLGNEETEPSTPETDPAAEHNKTIDRLVNEGKLAEAFTQIRTFEYASIQAVRESVAKLGLSDLKISSYFTGPVKVATFFAGPETMARFSEIGVASPLLASEPGVTFTNTATNTAGAIRFVGSGLEFVDPRYNDVVGDRAVAVYYNSDDQVMRVYEQSTNKLIELPDPENPPESAAVTELPSQFASRENGGVFSAAFLQDYPPEEANITPIGGGISTRADFVELIKRALGNTADKAALSLLESFAHAPTLASQVAIYEELVRSYDAAGVNGLYSYVNAVASGEMTFNPTGDWPETEADPSPTKVELTAEELAADASEVAELETIEEKKRLFSEIAKTRYSGSPEDEVKFLSQLKQLGFTTDSVDMRGDKDFPPVVSLLDTVKNIKILSDSGPIASMGSVKAINFPGPTEDGATYYTSIFGTNIKLDSDAVPVGIDAEKLRDINITRVSYTEAGVVGRLFDENGNEIYSANDKRIYEGIALDTSEAKPSGATTAPEAPAAKVEVVQTIAGNDSTSGLIREYFKNIGDPKSWSEIKAAIEQVQASGQLDEAKIRSGNPDLIYAGEQINLAPFIAAMEERGGAPTAVEAAREVVVDGGTLPTGVSRPLIDNYAEFREMSGKRFGEFINAMNANPDFLREAGISSGDINIVKAGDDIKLHEIVNKWHEVQSGSEAAAGLESSKNVVEILGKVRSDFDQNLVSLMGEYRPVKTELVGRITPATSAEDTASLAKAIMTRTIAAQDLVPSSAGIPTSDVTDMRLNGLFAPDGSFNQGVGEARLAGLPEPTRTRVENLFSEIVSTTDMKLVTPNMTLGEYLELKTERNELVLGYDAATKRVSYITRPAR